MDYPVQLERDDNDTILVSFPDFPEAHTFGTDIDDALVHAQDALATIVEAYIKDRRPIPLPSALPARHRVTMPAIIEAKVHLYETMLASKVNKSELARRLRVHLPQVDRILAVRHGSTFDQIESAYRALGKRMVIGIEDVAPAQFAAETRPKTARRATVARRAKKQSTAKR